MTMDEMIAIAIAKRNKPSSQQVIDSVNNWLNDHPEATTTVEDGAITLSKMNSEAIGTVSEFKTYLGMT